MAPILNYTPRVACESAFSKICAFSCVFSLSFFLAFSLDLNFFSLSYPFWFLIFSISISIFDVEVVFFILSYEYFFWVVPGMPYAVFSVSVATCTAYPMYLVRTCADLTFYFRLGCRCASVIMCIICLFLFFPRYSSTPELLEPVLRPRTALYLCPTDGLEPVHN